MSKSLLLEQGPFPPKKRPTDRHPRAHQLSTPHTAAIPTRPITITTKPDPHTLAYICEERDVDYSNG